MNDGIFLDALNVSPMSDSMPIRHEKFRDNWLKSNAITWTEKQSTDQHAVQQNTSIQTGTGEGLEILRISATSYFQSNENTQTWTWHMGRRLNNKCIMLQAFKISVLALGTATAAISTSHTFVTNKNVIISSVNWFGHKILMRPVKLLYSLNYLIVLMNIIINGFWCLPLFNLHRIHI